jgi:DNA segregation ATPase FtsK/SpoIIIE, S-DNA-T family
MLVRRSCQRIFFWLERPMAINKTFDRDDSVIPEGVRLFMRRRVREAGALILLALCVALGLALASWSAADPSPNNVIDGPASNWLGLVGAAISDQLLRYIGLASLALILPPVIWSIRMLVHEEMQSPRKMILWWLASVVAAALFFSSVRQVSWWPAAAGQGGELGDILSGGMNSLFGLAGQQQIASIVVAAVAFALMGWSLMGAVSINFEQARMKLSLLNSFGFMILARTINRVVGIKLPSLSLGLARPVQKVTKVKTPSALEETDEDDLDSDDIILPRKPIAVDVGDDDEFEDDVDDEVKAPTKSVAKAKPILKKKPAADSFELPELELLSEPKKIGRMPEISRETLEENARQLEGVLDDFGVKGQIVSVKPGPVVTLYELEPAPGIKSSRVISLADDIARSMSAVSARVAVVSGRNAIGIELPNAKRETVYLREMFAADAFTSSTAGLCIALGKNIGGEPVYADLARMPHLLIAGTTGSGKSVGINTMILSLLYRLGPDRCKLIMIDPKMLELSVYEGIPHLLAPVVTDPRKAVVALKWAVKEMEERYKKMSKIGVRNVNGYNERVAQLIAKGEKLSRTVQTGFDPQTGEPTFEQEEMETTLMPYIVVVIDEMADLMMVAGKDIEGAVQRLAQMARAAGIHVVMATQRPSVDVITGTIKANFPTRISFQVTSKIDSRTILGEQGAEQLLGQGDMLYMAGGGRISRLHGPFVSDSEVEAIVKHLKSQGAPDYVEAVTEEPDEDEMGDGAMGGGEMGSSGDALYDQAVAVVLRDKKVSTSYVQRRLQVGYNKAASLIERMEKEGLISSANATGKREILVPGDSARL